MAENRPRGEGDTEQASAAVRQAASVLEEEMSAGMGEARRLQRRFTAGRRLQPWHLDEFATWMRRNAHQLVDVVSERWEDRCADEVRGASVPLTEDAHKAIDVVMDLALLVPTVMHTITERAVAPPDDGA